MGVFSKLFGNKSKDDEIHPKKCFDVIVNTGNGVLYENGIIADNKEQIIDTYNKMGMNVTISREYYEKQTKIEGNDMQDPRYSGVTMDMLNTSKIDISNIPALMKAKINPPTNSNNVRGANEYIKSIGNQPVIKANETNVKPNDQNNSNVVNANLVNGNNNSNVVVQKNNTSTPKFFKIGNIDCKIENGNVYQKQWMRISDSELDNIRIISDKNNKIISMDGKHIEMLKWVLTEEGTNS